MLTLISGCAGLGSDPPQTTGPTGAGAGEQGEEWEALRVTQGPRTHHQGESRCPVRRGPEGVSVGPGE